MPVAGINHFPTLNCLWSPLGSHIGLPTQHPQEFIVDCFRECLDRLRQRDPWQGPESDRRRAAITQDIGSPRGHNLACWCRLSPANAKPLDTTCDACAPCTPKCSWTSPTPRCAARRCDAHSRLDPRHPALRRPRPRPHRRRGPQPDESYPTRAFIAPNTFSSVKLSSTFSPIADSLRGRQQLEAPHVLRRRPPQVELPVDCAGDP